MNWLREAIGDGASGRASSKRVAMLCAVFALSVAVVVLSVAAFNGRDVALALGTVTVPLAGLGGYSYVGGKIAENNRGDTTTSSSTLIQQTTEVIK
jgi:hypothetical protein